MHEEALKREYEAAMKLESLNHKSLKGGGTYRNTPFQIALSLVAGA